MKKSVMLSVNPKWAEKILNGEKTVEIRKSAPKLELPFTVYMYVTKGKPYLFEHPYNGYMTVPQKEFSELNGKVVASFVVDKIDKLEHDINKNVEYYFPITGCGITNANKYMTEICNNSCLNQDDLLNYGKDDTLKSYRHAKDLYAWNITQLNVFDKPRELSTFTHLKKGESEEHNYYIRKAPQSYMFCDNAEAVQ